MAKRLPPPAVMLNLTIGHWVSRLVHVAAKLRLADLLKDGARTAEDLATAAGVQAPALYRVLRALASVGVFAETKERRFKLTPLAATLQLLDIQMLIIGGRERTKKEFAAVFAAAGLKLTRVVPTKCPVSIVEGIRA